MSNEGRHTRLAVYPGSFDPLTNGHLDIARRAALLFDTLVIAVFARPAKQLLFSVEERVSLWQEVIAAEQLDNVRVETFDALVVDFIQAIGGQVIIKGLRSPIDFDVEFQQGQMNRKLSPGIETVCLFTRPEHLFISSSPLKEVTRLGGDVDDMLPPPVVKAMRHKFALE